MLKYLVQSVTQGSADAFAQAQVVTGLSNVSREAYRIRRIEFQFPPLINSADCNIQLCLTRKSQTAVPTLTDHSVIRMQTRFVDLTTSGTLFYAAVDEWQYSKDEDLVIVEDPLYFQLDSASTSLAGTAYVRIAYESRTISEVERLAIIAASLA